MRDKVDKMVHELIELVGEIEEIEGYNHNSYYTRLYNLLRQYTDKEA